MSPLNSATCSGWYRFPRVSGDEPGETVRTLVWGEFSPRERG